MKLIQKPYLILFAILFLGGVGVSTQTSYAADDTVHTYTKQKININQSHQNKTTVLPPEMMPVSEPQEIIIEKTIESAPTAILVHADNLTIQEAPALEEKIVVLDSEYILGSEDKIKITVFGEKDLSGDYKLGGDGAIAMPLIGVINLQGLSLRQAESEIETKLQDGYLKTPSVSIEVAESRPFYIMGEVRRPGSYNYINGMSVLQAVAISGGFTYRANQKTVDILRGNATPQEPKPYPPESAVRAGDIIFVRERFF